MVIFADVDECASDEANECDPNALCTNTEASYVCRCTVGFTGNGRNCSGLSLLSILSLPKATKTETTQFSQTSFREIL